MSEHSERLWGCLDDGTWVDGRCTLSEHQCHPDICPKAYYDRKGIEWRGHLGKRSEAERFGQKSF